MREMNLLGIVLIALNVVCFPLWGKIEISESVKDFRYPRFSEQGFVEWVLRGQSGTYDASLIAVDAFNLRLYSADAQTDIMCEVLSDHAVLDTVAGISYSDGLISIQGEGFEIKGLNWVWNSEERYVEIKSEVRVDFDQGISTTFTEVESMEGTSIKSDYLKLDLREGRYFFNFRDRVVLASDSLELYSHSLFLESLNQSEKDIDVSNMGDFSGLVLIKGSGNTEAHFLDRRIQSEAFEILPKKEIAVFSENAELTFNNTYLKGDRIEIQHSDVWATADHKRNYCSLAFDMSESISAAHVNSTDSRPIYIQSKFINFSKEAGGYDFIFENEVFYKSDSFRMFSDNLFVQTLEGTSSESSDRIQNLAYSEAEGSVYIEHDNYVVTCQSMKNFTPENRLELFGAIDFRTDLASIGSDKLVIEDLLVQAFKIDNQVRVHLPWSDAFSFEPSAQKSTEFDQRFEKESSVITSDIFRLETLDNQYECSFSQSVALNRGAFDMLSEDLQINWIRDSQVLSGYKVSDLIAENSVRLSQNEFKALSDKVVMSPDTERIELLGNAEMLDLNGSVTGERIVFDRITQKTEVYGSKETGQRAKVQFDLFENRSYEEKDVLEED